MSIATDEALEWHGLHGDENGDRDSSYSADEMDDAYIAGRSAEPTEAEIEAATMAIQTLEFSGEVGLQRPPTFRELAIAALKAARKAVTE